MKNEDSFCSVPRRIVIRGAREHNLKNVDLELPHGQFVVFTGLSGSGKSTLAFDTIFAEGQRRYLESLSSYARQFLGMMEKPKVDSIEGLSPAISIDQKTASHNPRSTVGTVTEIHDYLRLLFAKAGVFYCPECGREITPLATDEIVDRILDLAAGKKVKTEEFDKIPSTPLKKGGASQGQLGVLRAQILAPMVRDRKGEFSTFLQEMFQRGFSRAIVDGKEESLVNWNNIKLSRYKKHQIDILVDEVELDSENLNQIFEAVEIALKLANGMVKVRVEGLSFKTDQTAKENKNKARKVPAKTGVRELVFNQNLSCPEHPVEFPELEPRLFSFNSPHGACPACEGLGIKREIDRDLVMPDPNKTIAEGGLIPWSYKRNNFYGHLLSAVCQAFSISQHKRMRDLTEEELKILLEGPGAEYEDQIEVKYCFKSSSGHYKVRWRGLLRHLQDRYRKTDSEAVRKEVEKYMNNKPCSTCKGTRFRPEALWVKIGKKDIAEISELSAQEAEGFFQTVKLTEKQQLISEQILKEICNRLSFLISVGLDYLTLNRAANTLSGGEAQRIRLASQIGSGLTGVLYILDEPSIGLHPRDNSKLLEMLVQLKNIGNSVIVIEHDEETIRQAEFLVDVGPGAGKHGGKVIHAGSVEQLLKLPEEASLTADYLVGRRQIAVPAQRRVASKKQALVVKGAREHNLKNLTVEFPLKTFTCVTGVSGSGKSTLVEEILYKWLANRLHRALDVPGKVTEVANYSRINKVIMIDQAPIGRTPRSNPATYTGVFTPIRALFAKTKEARARGYQPGRFSFNVPGGRCDTCKGDGYLKVEMQFMADVYLPCEVCRGKRYNSQTLQVRYRDKNIAQVLEMTVNEATDFFQKHPEIHTKLKTLQDVGLGYIHLGQSATTLSGGEAQRIKLSSELARRNTGNTLYILDEPTTGLHFEDVKKLLEVLHRLVDAGNTVVVIEHNLDVIKTADWIIDLGPEGGKNGGKLVAAGSPEQLAANEQSATGEYLREMLSSET